MDGSSSENDKEKAADPPKSPSSRWGEWGGWLQQTVQTAKDKSVSALDFVKKDIEEFTATMQSDSKSAAQNIREQLNQESAKSTSAKMRQGVSSFFGEITKILTVDAEDLEEPSAPAITGQGIFDRAQARLHAIQLDPGTYLNEPTGSKEEYGKWCKEFDMEGKKGDISELLVANVQVRGLYTQMVPSQVSHADFWRHYYYKVHQLEQDEARKAELMRRAEEIQNKEEEGWDDEDDWGDIAGPSSPPRLNKGSTEEALPTPADSTVTQLASHNRDTSPDDAKQFYSLIPVDDNVQISCDTSSECVVTGSGSQDTLTVVTADTTSSCDDLSVSELVSPVSRVAGGDKVESGDVVVSGDETDVKTKEKGDLVVIGSSNSSEQATMSSDISSTGSASHNKAESLDEDWEKDFDIEVTEEDIQAAQEAANRLALSKDNEGEDWEEWE